MAALTGAQIQAQARAGILNEHDLGAAYVANNIPFPQRLTYAQLIAQSQGVNSPDANGKGSPIAPAATIVSSGGGVPAPSEAQTAPLLASLASLDTILGNKNQGSQDEYGRAIAGYDAQDELDHRAIQQNTEQNEGNYTANNQSALLNAANASSGLRGVLSSIGGLAGSGVNIVKKLVGLAANSDTGAARTTFNTNATDLSQAAANTTQLEKQRRDDAAATLANNKQNNQAQVLNSKQSIYQQLASLFGAGTAKGDEYASTAAGLAAPIAATTKASVAPYAASSSLYSPAALATYLAGTQKLNASATSGTDSSIPINAPGYGSPTKKDTLTGVA